MFWRKNVMLPEVSSDKDYIKEISKLINEWLIEVQSGNVQCTSYM